MKNGKSIMLIPFFLLSLFSGFAQNTMLSSNEKDDLLFMIEEEKMARDVYLVFQEKWNRTIFKHIAEAEQRHIDLLIQLAEDEGLRYPSAITENENGVFENKEIQSLYHNFIKRGEISYELALKQGAKLEEIDIKDLRERMANTENVAIDEIYERLEKASNHHLQAFVRQLEKEGVDYQPVVLDQATFDQVLKTPKNGNAAKPGCTPQAKGKNGKGCCAGKQNKGNKKSGKCCKKDLE